MTSLTLALPEAPAYRLAAFVAVALLAVAAIALYASPGEALAVTAAGAALIVCACTDLERRIIPNAVVVPGFLMALIVHAVHDPGSLPTRLITALVLGLLFVLPGLVNRAAMGMGDVKLVMFLGAALGLAAIAAVTIAFLAIFPIALGVLIRGRGRARGRTLAFGPFLAFGGVVTLLLPGIVH